MSDSSSSSTRRLLLAPGVPTAEQIAKLYGALTGHEVTPADQARIEQVLAGRPFVVHFIANDHANPSGKLADAELHFTSGPLEGLKLVGFAIWERRTGGRNVTFPARQYSVNGERRSFALLRPTADGGGSDRLRDLILDAFTAHEAAADGGAR